MTLAGSGMLASAVDALKESLANSATFQTLTGTANATDAKEFIYRNNVQVDGASAVDRPYAVLNHESGSSEVIGSGPTVRTTGQVFASLHFDIPSTPTDYQNDEDADTYAQNQGGAIAAEIMAQAHTAGRLAADSKSVDWAYIEDKESNQGEWHGSVDITFDYTTFE